jgi:predicted metal-dependent phosphotriesterase family hydrolase
MGRSAASWVQTVLAPIPAETLGITYVHEHLATAPPELVAREADLVLDDLARIRVDLLEFRRAGGHGIVEMTTRDYGRDVRALRRLAQETGVAIVAATGFNKGVYCRPYCEGADPDVLARQQVLEVLRGIDGTEVRAGVHKFGTSLHAIHPWEEVAARAAARAHRETGAPILTHTERGTMAPEQLALLASEGVPPQAVVLCHMDLNPDLELHRRLADRGAFLSYDQIPKPKYATEGHAVRLIVELARQGLHRQLLLAGDFARRSYFRGWGGSPGLTYLLRSFAPKLRAALGEAGLDPDRVLEDLFVHNPARALALRR